MALWHGNINEDLSNPNERLGQMALWSLKVVDPCPKQRFTTYNKLRPHALIQTKLSINANISHNNSINNWYISILRMFYDVLEHFCCFNCTIKDKKRPAWVKWVIIILFIIKKDLQLVKIPNFFPSHYINESEQFYILTLIGEPPRWPEA